MSKDISNRDDVIDSRDVVARLEELESLRKPWIAGCNMPGYMPDTTPCGFETCEDARAAIISDLEEAIEIADENSETDTIADLESAIAKLNAATDDSEYGETIGSWHYWISQVDGREAFEDESDFDEYQALKAFAEEAENYCSDWAHGELLIRDSYFETYARELADDIGAVKSDAGWPNSCIDWEQAASELQTDYSSAEFDGVTYWFR